jgi:uncharacterized membrane protein
MSGWILLLAVAVAVAVAVAAVIVALNTFLIYQTLTGESLLTKGKPLAGRLSCWRARGA